MRFIWYDFKRNHLFTFPLWYLVAQLVKNLPAMQEALVQFLGWEDPLWKGMATHSSILAWRIPWTICTWGPKKLDMTKQLSLFLIFCGSCKEMQPMTVCQSCILLPCWIFWSVLGVSMWSFRVFYRYSIMSPVFNVDFTSPIILNTYNFFSVCCA